MSGKLIMKRKRADQRRDQEQQQYEEQPAQQPDTEKRQRLELQPDQHQPALPALPPTPPMHAVDPGNSILLEALQKIMELQAELDTFEHDLDEREASELEGDEEEADDEAEDADVAANFMQPARRSEAEALGFAMCARETLLFLQSEGISTESVLYKALLGKLVGQSDGLLQA